MSGQWWWAYRHGHRQTQGGFSNLVGHALKSEAQKGLTWTFHKIIWTTMDMLHGIMLLQNMALSPSHDLAHLNQLIQLMAVSCFVSPHSRYGSCSSSDTLHFSPLLSLSLPPSPVIHSWHVKLTSNLAVLQYVIRDIKVNDSTVNNNHKHFIKTLLGYPKIINELVSNNKSNSSQVRNFAVCQFGN